MLHIKQHSKIVIYGGNHETGVLKDLLIFDYMRFKWIIKEKKEYLGICAHSGAYDDISDMIYLYGGGNLKEAFINIYCVNPGNNWQWDLMVTKDTPNPRIGHVSWIHNGCFYSFGGFNPKYGYLNEIVYFSLPE